ncbi:MAG TPA: 2-dehydropantoate 2-reductase [Candidatus Limnocylindrales bacterium]|nr:2-dehydropantoate 2-reductase [Candidatus Limnocylindrales bacterium]
MRIVVVGAGGVGGYFGGRLATAGHDVAFVARGAHLEALRHNGLRVSSVHGDFSVGPVRASTDAGELGPADAVLLAVKTWQLEPAIEAVKSLAGNETAVVTLQNGVDAPEQAARILGREAIVPGIAKVLAFIESPGHIRHMGAGALAFAEWDNSPSPRVERLRAALEEAGLVAERPRDIWTALWAKFLFVAPLGGLGAVADAPFGPLRDRPGLRSLLGQAMGEVEQIARRRGIRLPDDVVAKTLAVVDEQPVDGTTSLHRDLRSGRPSELDAWTGAIVRLGAQAGVPTPVNGFCYEVLSFLAVKLA